MTGLRLGIALLAFGFILAPQGVEAAKGGWLARPKARGSSMNEGLYKKRMQQRRARARLNQRSALRRKRTRRTRLDNLRRERQLRNSRPKFPRHRVTKHKDIARSLLQASKDARAVAHNTGVTRGQYRRFSRTWKAASKSLVAQLDQAASTANLTRATQIYQSARSLMQARAAEAGRSLSGHEMALLRRIENILIKRKREQTGR
jgi:hypothetical protein